MIGFEIANKTVEEVKAIIKNQSEAIHKCKLSIHNRCGIIAPTLKGKYNRKRGTYE